MTRAAISFELEKGHYVCRITEHGYAWDKDNPYHCFKLNPLTAVREYEERFETCQNRNPDMSPDQVSAFVLAHWYESVKSVRELERMGEVEP